jgi:hypothetical protein
VKLRRTGSVIGAAVVVGVLFGAALGVLWWRLAPRVPLTLRPEGDVWAGYQPEEYIGADVAFGALAFIAGVAVTLGFIRVRRHQMGMVLIGTLLAGVIGTAVMWFVGTRLGSVDIEGLAATTDADLVVDAPLEVTLPGVYLIWPIVSSLIITVLSATDVWAEWRGRGAEQPQP